MEKKLDSTTSFPIIPEKEKFFSKFIPNEVSFLERLPIRTNN